MNRILNSYNISFPFFPFCHSSFLLFIKVYLCMCHLRSLIALWQSIYNNGCIHSGIKMCSFEYRVFQFVTAQRIFVEGIHRGEGGGVS